MNHVIYVNAKTRELEKLLIGKKTMIIRGATGRRLPHGRVKQGDTLYSIRNNAEGLVWACWWKIWKRSGYNQFQLTTVSLRGVHASYTSQRFC